MSHRIYHRGGSNQDADSWRYQAVDRENDADRLKEQVELYEKSFQSKGKSGRHLAQEKRDRADERAGFKVRHGGGVEWKHEAAD